MTSVTPPRAAADRLAARVDGLLNRDRVRGYAVIGLTISIVAQLTVVLVGRFPLTSTGDVVLPDYLARWTGARLVLSGQAQLLYDPGVQRQLQHTEVPGSPGLSWFVSPPFAVFGHLPLGLLPYGASALLWCAVTIGLLVVAARAVRPLCGAPGTPGAADRRLLLLVFAASPAVFELVGGGQDTAVVLVLVCIALRQLLRGRDVAAGALLALAAMKPQLLVLAPVALVVQQRWRALAAFAGTGAGLVLVSLPVVGVAGWRAWLAALHSPLYLSGVQQGQTWKMQSISSLATALGTVLGAPPAPLMALGSVVLVLGAAVLALRAWSVRGDTEQVWALTLLTTVVCSPHVLAYDLVLLLPVMVHLHRRLDSRAVRLLAAAIVVLLATVGVRHVVATALGEAGRLLEAPWSALALLGLWVVVLRTEVPLVRAHPKLVQIENS